MIAIKAFYEVEGKFISFDPEENGNDITLYNKTVAYLATVSFFI